MKRLLLLISAAIAVLVGLGFIMPAVAQWRALGGMTGPTVGLLILGLLLTLGGVATAYRQLSRRTR